ncbi:hypothetical protein ACFVFT_14680 [Streptomyces tendae]|uniref:hypothetical protein n=1 Tax=Streptomyces tendae TaxID=1932 RepID=UPI00369F64B9
MSAPLVVNTRDGACWTRRTVTEGGIALYALADVCSCPELVMATLDELAARGIAGSADVLPMPVGPEPQADDRAKAPWGRGEDGRPLLPMGAHWTDVPEAVDRRVAKIQTRVDEAKPGPWYRAPATELGVTPGTVRTRIDGYPRMVGQFTNVSPADLEMVLYAGSDLRWCLSMIAKFRARVAELETAQQPAEGSSYPSALPWAKHMDADDLEEFLADLTAAIVGRDGTAALDEVEKTCGAWRLIAEAQHAHNTAPGPDAAEAGEAS